MDKKIKIMKRIIAFLFLSFLFQSFAFCQIDSPIVSIYPHFPSCQKLKASNLDFLKCTDEAFLNFLIANIEYPKEALKNKIEGEAMVNFSIKDNGTLRQAKITYDWKNPKPKADSILQKEVLRVINKMPKWIINKSIIRPNYPSFDVYVDFKSQQFSIKIKRNYGLIKTVENLKLEMDEYWNTKEENEKKRQDYYQQQLEAQAKDSTLIIEEFIIRKPKPHIPLFPGCEGNFSDKKKLLEYSEIELMKFIYSYIKYPRKASKNNTQGIVIAQFIVDQIGFVRHIEIIQDIGNGCGEEVQRVINSMNSMGQKWTPGPSRGKPTKARFTVSVHFKM